MQSLLPMCSHEGGSLKETVGPIVRRSKRFLDGTWADPAQKVERASRLVVGPATTGTAKGLLSNNGPGGLVVDVEVSSAVSKGSNGGLNVSAVGGKDGTREGVFRSGVAEFQRRFKILVFVNMDREDRAKDFLRHGFASWVVAHNGRWLNEVARGIVVGASSDDVAVGIGSSAVNVAGDAVKRLLVDDGAEVVAEIADVADGDLVDFGDIVVLDGVPDRTGHIDSAGGTALLSLELKAPAKHGNEQGATVAIGVGDNEVLPTSFSNDTRVGFEVLEVVGHVSPHLAEDTG